jgi:cytochrome c oxidase cbb3-type subunit 3
MSHDVSSPEPADELMTDHSYDGIQEYDNPLPGWWTWMFALSVVFALPYWAWFHMGTPGRSMFDEYNNETARILNLRFAELGELEPTQENLLKYMNDDKWIKVGIATYQANCVSCHGQNGEGVVGPNLTDEVYKNVRTIEDLVTVIEKGANNGAMPAWGKRFSHPNVAILTAAYIASMRGKNEAGRQPEGNAIPPWPTK